jgi:hypothetical protein
MAGRVRQVQAFVRERSQEQGLRGALSFRAEPLGGRLNLARGTCRVSSLGWSGVGQLGRDLDRTTDAPSHRAATCVERVGPFRGLSLILRAARQPVSDPDALDHQDPLLKEHLSLGFTDQAAVAGLDPARLQRASERAGQSSCCRGDDVVKGGGVLGIRIGWCSVMFTDRPVCTEEDRGRLRW